MTTKTIPQVATIGSRPTHTPDGTPIPAHWPIHNAPRPLYGQINWCWPQAPFRCFGWWFAAVDPDHEYSQGTRGYIEENRRLDARELIFVTDEEAFQRGVTELRQRYGARLPDFEKLVNDPEHRDHFVRTGIECMAIEAEGEQLP